MRKYDVNISIIIEISTCYFSCDSEAIIKARPWKPALEAEKAISIILKNN